MDDFTNQTMELLKRNALDFIRNPKLLEDLTSTVDALMYIQ